MAAQRFPEEYDGYVIAAPAINWDRFIPSELWPEIVMNQELGPPISPAKLNAFNGRGHRGLRCRGRRGRRRDQRPAQV